MSTIAVAILTSTGYFPTIASLSSPLSIVTYTGTTYLGTSIIVNMGELIYGAPMTVHQGRTNLRSLVAERFDYREAADEEQRLQIQNVIEDRINTVYREQWEFLARMRRRFYSITDFKDWLQDLNELLIHLEEQVRKLELSPRGRRAFDKLKQARNDLRRVELHLGAANQEMVPRGGNEIHDRNRDVENQEMVLREKNEIHDLSPEEIRQASPGVEAMFEKVRSLKERLDKIEKMNSSDLEYARLSKQPESKKKIVEMRLNEVKALLSCSELKNINILLTQQDKPENFEERCDQAYELLCKKELDFLKLDPTIRQLA